MGKKEQGATENKLALNDANVGDPLMKILKNIYIIISSIQEAEKFFFHFIFVFIHSPFNSFRI